MKARNKKTGEIVEVKIYNNMYAIRYDKFGMYSKTLFDTLYEQIEDLNHPYGGMEVEEMTELDNSQNYKYLDMVERFNMKFVDEDTALLNIGKYDEDRVIKFITTLFKKQREEYDKKIEELNNEIYDLNESIDFMSK